MSASTFTPSNLTHEQLEALLTARGDLVEDICTRIRDGVETQTRRSLLLVGPRGIGKTFLVSLIHHRLLAEKKIKDKLAVAWLAEDPYSISSYVTLLREIMIQLDISEGVPGWPKLLAEIKTAANESTQIALLEDALIETLGNRGLFLIAENLDDIFEALGDLGQKQLRPLLQSKLSTFLLCSTTSMVSGINNRDAAFHGFFDIRDLRPFSFEECVETLVNLAHALDNKNVAELLQTPKGRARVRAIHHLAGGNPRVYTIFYEFLALETLDEIKQPFFKLIDSLTPYYQSRMQTLSPRQRQYVDVLRRGAIPMAVKDIAGEALVPPNSASKDLARLRELGYVTSISVGRESLYELREPLMRICLAVKEERGGTIPLFVDFLRVWFIEDTGAGIGFGLSNQLLKDPAYKQELERVGKEKNARVEFHLARIEADAEGPDCDETKRIQLRALYHGSPGLSEVWWKYQEQLILLKRWDDLVEETRFLTERYPDNAFLWDDLAYYYEELPNIPAMLQASTRAQEIHPENTYLRLNHLYRLRRHQQPAKVRQLAQQYLDEIEELNEDKGKDNFNWQDSKLLEYHCLAILGRNMESLDCNLQYLESNWSDYESWRNLMATLQNLYSESSNLLISELCTELLFSENPLSWRDRAVCLRDAGRYEDAKTALQKGNLIKPGLDESEYQFVQFNIDIMAGDLEAARSRVLPSTRQLLAKGQFYETRLRLTLDILDGELEKAGEYLNKIVGYYFNCGQQSRAGVPLFLARLTDSDTVLTAVAKIWRTAYMNNEDGLSHLGKNLLRTILNPWGQLSNEQLFRWCRIWEEVSADDAEMIIPLRLMHVAVDFRKTQSNESLVGLRKEERSLLDENIRYYLRGLELEPDPLLEKIETFVKEVREQADKKKEDEERQAMIDRWTEWFNSPVPEIAEKSADTILTATLATYHSRAKVKQPLAYLIPGPWHTLAKKDTLKLLKRLIADSEDALKLLQREDCRVLRLDSCPLPFSSGQLFQLHLDTPGGIAALDFWADDEEIVVFTGSSGEIYDLVKREKIHLDNENTAAYIVFFSSCLRADKGRFQAVQPDNKAVLKMLKKAGFKGKASSRPDGFEIELKEKSDPDLESLIIYGLYPFWAVFQITELASGIVDMVSDIPLDDKQLRLPQEIFAGPLRLWEPEGEDISE